MLLEAIFGNQTIEKVLLFLFVNGKGYGTQIQKQLCIALTPIQKAFERLERGEVITSYYEGKTRIYQFNPHYPLLGELESFLKKGFSLLPSQHKRDFYAIKREPQKSKKEFCHEKSTLLLFWNRLQNIKQLQFHAHSKSKTDHGWNGKGLGEVTITKESEDSFIFYEKGHWKDKNQAEYSFSNIFRWSLDKKNGIITLENLRRGINDPILLFHLSPSDDHTLTSVDSHLWEGDLYFGHISYDRKRLRFNWRIIGPKKNEEIDYIYL